MNGITAILQIFYAPGAVFEKVRAGLSVWPGLVILILCALLVVSISLPMQKELALQVIGEKPNLSEEELADAPQAANPDKKNAISYYVQALIMAPLAILVVSFLYWLALNITFSGVPFGRVLVLFVYTGFIGIAFEIIDALYMRFSAPIIRDFASYMDAGLDLSLAVFLGDSSTWLGAFLAQWGVFQIWGLALFVGGVAHLLGRKWTSVLWPVLAIRLIITVSVSFLMSFLMSFLAGLSTAFGG